MPNNDPVLDPDDAELAAILAIKPKRAALDLPALPPGVSESSPQGQTLRRTYKKAQANPDAKLRGGETYERVMARIAARTREPEIPNYPGVQNQLGGPWTYDSKGTRRSSAHMGLLRGAFQLGSNVARAPWLDPTHPDSNLGTAAIPDVADQYMDEYTAPYRQAHPGFFLGGQAVAAGAGAALLGGAEPAVARGAVAAAPRAAQVAGELAGPAVSKLASAGRGLGTLAREAGGAALSTSGPLLDRAMQVGLGVAGGRAASALWGRVVKPAANWLGHGAAGMIRGARGEVADAVYGTPATQTPGQGLSAFEARLRGPGAPDPYAEADYTRAYGGGHPVTSEDYGVPGSPPAPAAPVGQSLQRGTGVSDLHPEYTGVYPADWNVGGFPPGQGNQGQPPGPAMGQPPEGPGSTPPAWLGINWPPQGEPNPYASELDAIQAQPSGQVPSPPVLSPDEAWQAGQISPEQYHEQEFGGGLPVQSPGPTPWAPVPGEDLGPGVDPRSLNVWERQHTFPPWGREAQAGQAEGFGGAPPQATGGTGEIWSPPPPGAGPGGPAGAGPGDYPGFEGGMDPNQVRLAKTRERIAAGTAEGLRRNAEQRAMIQAAIAPHIPETIPPEAHAEIYEAMEKPSQALEKAHDSGDPAKIAQANDAQGRSLEKAIRNVETRLAREAAQAEAGKAKGAKARAAAAKQGVAPAPVGPVTNPAGAAGVGEAGAGQGAEQSAGQAAAPEQGLGPVQGQGADPSQALATPDEAGMAAAPEEPTGGLPTGFPGQPEDPADAVIWLHERQVEMIRAGLNPGPIEQEIGRIITSVGGTTHNVEDMLASGREAAMSLTPGGSSLGNTPAKTLAGAGIETGGKEGRNAAMTGVRVAGTGTHPQGEHGARAIMGGDQTLIEPGLAALTKAGVSSSTVARYRRIRADALAGKFPDAREGANVVGNLRKAMSSTKMSALREKDPAAYEAALAFIHDLNPKPPPEGTGGAGPAPAPGGAPRPSQPGGAGRTASPDEPEPQARKLPHPGTPAARRRNARRDAVNAVITPEQREMSRQRQADALAGMPAPPPPLWHFDPMERFQHNEQARIDKAFPPKDRPPFTYVEEPTVPHPWDVLPKLRLDPNAELSPELQARLDRMNQRIAGRLPEPPAPGNLVPFPERGDAEYNALNAGAPEAPGEPAPTESFDPLAGMPSTMMSRLSQSDQAILKGLNERWETLHTKASKALEALHKSRADAERTGMDPRLAARREATDQANLTKLTTMLQELTDRIDEVEARGLGPQGVPDPEEPAPRAGFHPGTPRGRATLAINRNRASDTPAQHETRRWGAAQRMAGMWSEKTGAPLNPGPQDWEAEGDWRKMVHPDKPENLRALPLPELDPAHDPNYGGTRPPGATWLEEVLHARIEQALGPRPKLGPRQPEWDMALADERARYKALSGELKQVYLANVPDNLHPLWRHPTPPGPTMESRGDTAWPTHEITQILDDHNVPNPILNDRGTHMTMQDFFDFGDTLYHDEGVHGHDWVFSMHNATNGRISDAQLQAFYDATYPDGTDWSAPR
jgi:hypothetical protein